jgi:hypothetical protein
MTRPSTTTTTTTTFQSTTNCYMKKRGIQLGLLRLRACLFLVAYPTNKVLIYFLMFFKKRYINSENMYLI